MYIPGRAAAGKASTKDSANIRQEGKGASCRGRYDQVQLFLPRACCHYSFLSHANVQISLRLVRAHGDLADRAPVPKAQRAWEHSANGVEALSRARDPAPRDPISPRPSSGPSVAFSSVSWETGGEWEGFWWRLGWSVQHGLGGGCRGTWAAAGAPLQGAEMPCPCGAGICPPAGLAELT